MRNATVGMRRLIARLRPDPGHRSAAAVTFQRRSISIARGLRAGSTGRRGVSGSLSWSLARSLSGERLVTVTAVGLVAIALVLSNVGTGLASGPTGNTNGAGAEPRIAVGGAVSGLANAPQGGIDDRIASEGQVTGLDGSDQNDGSWDISAGEQVTIDGPFGSDGTLLKPISVDTTVADGAELIRSYRVKSGDTLTGIASKFHVSMMTVWWADRKSVV